MSTPRIEAGESEAFEMAEQATRPLTEGQVRIFNRVIEWVTTERFQLMNLTERMNELVRKSGVREGTIHLQSLHTTTAVFLNEWQDALLHDMKTCMEGLVDRSERWRHNDPQYSDCERSNADSHLRGMLLGQTLCLQVRNSKVLLGTWQNIIFAEFDGPRSRTLAIQISGI
jgi:secondary thiamine-phosphate synthase enzyme